MKFAESGSIDSIITKSARWTYPPRLDRQISSQCAGLLILWKLSAVPANVLSLECVYFGRSVFGHFSGGGRCLLCSGDHFSSWCTFWGPRDNWRNFRINLLIAFQSSVFHHEMSFSTTCNRSLRTVQAWTPEPLLYEDTQAGSHSRLCCTCS